MHVPTTDTARWRCRWKVEKYRADVSHETPADEVIEGEGNLLMTNGANALWTALTGGAITAFSNANANLGVGDSSTAENAAQTDLQASSNKLRKGMNATYPQISGNQVTFQATFGSSDANFAWSEWGIFNASSSGTMLNRKVQALGTKSSGAVWVLTVSITLS
jgi:hypothetical protein